MCIFVRNVGQWVVIVLVLRLPGDHSNRFSRSAVTDMHVCVIRPTTAIRENVGCRFEQQRQQSDYVVFLSQVITCCRCRVVVLGGGGVTLSRSCVPTYLRRVFALWFVARGAVGASVNQAAQSVVTSFIVMQYVT